MTTIPTEAQKAAAAAIAARFRSWLPESILQEPTEPAHIALLDLDAIVREENIGDSDAIAWALQMAVENSAQYTEDGCSDPECEEALGDEGDPIVEAL